MIPANVLTFCLVFCFRSALGFSLVGASTKEFGQIDTQMEGQSINLKQLLKEFVANNVSIQDETTTKANVEIVTRVIGEQFINRMRRVDSLFGELYQNIYYAGSYYERLKVGEANEFDLNIRLKMPFKQANILIITAGVAPGYAMYKLTAPYDVLLFEHRKWEIFKKFSKLFDDSKMYLSQEKLNKWLQSVVDTAILRSEDIFTAANVTVRRSYSGPAQTLTMMHGGTKFSLDLVPVIELADFPHSVGNRRFLDDLPLTKKTCFIVPKPPPNDGVASGKALLPKSPTEIPDEGASADPSDSQQGLIRRFLTSLFGLFFVGAEAPSPSVPPPPAVNALPQSKYSFRVSIPDAERYMMENKGCVKMLIKIFKAIRDHEKWTFFSSYYVKTIFMWELELDDVPASYWKESNLDVLFVDMLTRFVDRLLQLELPHIFFPRFNLIENVRKDTLTNMRGHLAKILRWSRTDLDKLANYLNPGRSNLLENGAASNTGFKAI